MIIASITGICLAAAAGYVGYKNKDTISTTLTWNGLKLYSYLKEYYDSFLEGFTINNIKVEMNHKFAQVVIDKWEDVDIYMMGLKPDAEHIKSMIQDDPSLENNTKFTNGSFGISYILDGNNYYNLYICDKINVAKYINDVDRLKNGTFEVDNIQKILSATYCDGQEIRDVTELLQMFNISGNFYDNNESFTFKDIVNWYYELDNSVTNGWLEEWNLNDSSNEHYLEIINICGDCQIFEVNDIIRFNRE
jgi:hypothetical protein